MLKTRRNIWQSVDADCIVVPTNGSINDKSQNLVQDEYLLKRYPGIENILGGYIRRYGNNAHVLTPLSFFKEKFDIVSFPIKECYNSNIDIELVKTSAKQLIILAKKHKKWINVYIQGFGDNKINKVLGYILKDNTFTLVYKEK